MPFEPRNSRPAKPFTNQGGPVRPEIQRPAAADALIDALKPGSSLPPAEPVIVDEFLAQMAAGYIIRARSDSTRRAYENDFRHFQQWCEDGGYKALPATAETVQFYLVDHAPSDPHHPLAISTLERRLVGISRMHKEHGFESPTRAVIVRDTLQGIRREAADDGNGLPRQAAPIMMQDLREIIESITGDSLQAKRDRALLLIAFAAALRAGEVGRIGAGDLRESHRGFIITLWKSKTDQTGKGQQIAVPYASKGNEDVCPVRALKAWLAASKIKTGPVFRYVDRHGNLGTKGITRHSVNRVIRRVATGAGYEDTTKLSGHSLRAGLATSAANNQAAYAKIKAQGRWKSDRVLNQYIRDAELFRDNAATTAGF